MFDMHSHILPAIDDGSKDTNMSLDMLRIASQSGTIGIVATPHVIRGAWLPAWDNILKECSRLSGLAQQSGINISVFPGAEVSVNLDILDLLTAPGAYCINGGRYMLVELPAAELPPYTDEFLFNLQARGITPIMAHPERHRGISKKPELLADWINRGVLSQLHGASLIGTLGRLVKDTAELLLTNNMVHIIGSDAHSNRTRNPKLSSVADRIIDLVGYYQAEKLLVTNPQRIICSENVVVNEVERIKRQQTGRIYNFWKNVKYKIMKNSC